MTTILAQVFLWLLVALVPTVFFLLRSVVVPRSVSHGAPEAILQSPRFRSTKSENIISETSVPNVKTLYDLLKFATKKYSSRDLFGQRSLKRVVTEEKKITKVVDGVEKAETKTWNYFELSGYDWLSYNDVFTKAKAIGSGLRTLGLGRGDLVTIFAPTNRDWMIFAHGCFTQSLTITTAYETLGEDGLSFSLNEGEITTLFTSYDHINLLPKISALSPTLKNIIFAGKVQDEALLAKVKGDSPNLQIMSLDELVSAGKNMPAEPIPPKSEDICCIMYTSGSTGNPKGVLLSHANLIAALSGTEAIIGNQVNKSDVYLAYLPLAHILEFIVETTCIWLGIPLGYGSIKTLTDASVRNCKGDIRELRPTIMAGVPAVWEGIRKGALAKVDSLSPFMQTFFGFMLKAKWNLMTMGLPTPFIDRLVFNKIKEATGGRLRFALSGGAPIPAETHKFLTVCVCPVLQGYGMTETCGIVAIQDVDQIGVLNEVGPPSPSVEIKLVSEKDSNYSIHNNPPQGEIWVRGGSITRGYYKNTKATNDTLTEDGWLMTGDIGQINPNGCISIIDRKKNLIKLAHGEYIALEKLEAIYKTSSYINNVCCYADSEKSFVVAVISPIEKEVKKLAVEQGLSLSEGSVDLGELENNSILNKILLKDLVKVGKLAGLNRFELVGGVLLTPHEWTPENGMLTAAMKLKRKEIVGKYQSYIDQMYASI